MKNGPMSSDVAPRLQAEVACGTALGLLVIGQFGVLVWISADRYRTPLLAAAELFLGGAVAAAVVSTGWRSRRATGHRKLTAAAFASLCAGIGPIVFAIALNAVLPFLLVVPLTLCAVAAAVQCFRGHAALREHNAGRGTTLTGQAVWLLAVPATIVAVLAGGVALEAAQGGDLADLNLLAGLAGFALYCGPAFTAALIAASARWWFRRGLAT